MKNYKKKLDLQNVYGNAPIPSCISCLLLCGTATPGIPDIEFLIIYALNNPIQ